MTFNNDPRIKAFLFALVILIIGLSYLTKILSDNFLYNYLAYFKSKLIKNVLVGLHWAISIVTAFLLPDYLMKYDFFKRIFEHSGMWINLATLLVFLISVITIGILLNLALISVLRKKTNQNNLNQRTANHINRKLQ